jgi:hypothetical protein
MMGTRRHEGAWRIAIVDIRRLVLVTLTVTLIMGLGISPDAQSATSASPAGKYSAVVFPLDGAPFREPLVLTNSQNFVLKKGPRGRWAETNEVITMTGRFETVPFVFVINQMGSDLGKLTEKGSVTEGGHPYGKWFAKRV